jgi:hypothetical protein
MERLIELSRADHEEIHRWEGRMTTPPPRTSAPATGIHLTEKYQVLPSMPPDQYAALKADIAERGVLVPIDIDEDGNILDGHHRYRACVELGITDFPTIVRPGLSEEEKRTFARNANVLRRHLTRAQIRSLVAEQIRETPSWANRRIGQALGVDHKTVRALRGRLEATGEIPRFERLDGADGKVRTATPRRPPALMAPTAKELGRILKGLDKLSRRKPGALAEEIQEFLSAQSFGSLAVFTYDPFADCNETEIREWGVFELMLVRKWHFSSENVDHHICWLLRHDFKTPAEWLGEEGIHYRERYGMRQFGAEVLPAWRAFLAEHRDKSPKEIWALIRAEVTRRRAGLRPPRPSGAPVA